MLPVRRIRRLREAARRLASKGQANPQRRLCMGLGWEELLRRVDEATDEADGDLVGRILGFVQEANATPAAATATPGHDRDAEGEPACEEHFFVTWLHGLLAGSWSLPRAALEGLCSRYGAVLWRCEGCWLGLGNARRFDFCPACGSAALSHKRLSGPPWDPMHVYTPLPDPRRQRRRDASAET